MLSTESIKHKNLCSMWLMNNDFLFTCNDKKISYIIILITYNLQVSCKNDPSIN